MTGGMMSDHPYGKLLVLDDADQLARRAADYIFERASKAPGRVRIALSGGSTPKKTYQELAGPRLIKRFPWQKVEWYWGDERFVPSDNAESNFRMVREAMLDAAPIPPANIHPIPTTGMTIDDAVHAYEAALRDAYGSSSLVTDRALFDLCLLGLGDDGHTASLLPGEPVLDERRHWVAAVAHGRPEERITLTYPAINSSRHILFLVSGDTKQAILKDVLSGDSQVPAARLKPLGDLLFIADRAAASI